MSWTKGCANTNKDQMRLIESGHEILEKVTKRSKNGNEA